MGDVTWWRCLLLLLVVTLCAAYNNPPSLQDKVATRVIAKLGRTTKLRCNTDSIRDMTSWKKDGQAVNLGLARYQVTSAGVLRIKNTQMSDAGVYTCIAVNGFGALNIDFTVIVLDEKNKRFQENGIMYEQNPDEDLNKEGFIPFFPDLAKMEESRILRKPTGSTLKLVCKVEGYPEPNVQWYKDGELFNNERRSLDNLKVHHVSEADSGLYMCVAKNRLGVRNFTYNLQVIGKIREKPRLIAPHPLNRTVAVGDYASFQCDIESVVEPVVQWLKRVDEYEDIPDKTLIHHENEKYRVLKNKGVLLAKSDGSFLNKLVIQNVRPQDAGKFVCLAVNKGGSNSRHAFLHVRPRNAGDQFNPSLLEARSSGRPKSQDSSEASSQNSSEDINWALFIGLPACVLLIVIILVVVFMQRNNRCHCSDTNAKAPRTPVPPQERDAYYYSNCQQQHLQQSVNPLLQQSREKSSKTPTPSVDMTGSEFSSVSRTHHNPHYYHHNNHNNHNNHMNYGY